MRARGLILLTCILLLAPTLGAATGPAFAFSTHVAPGWVPEMGEPSIGANRATGAIMVQSYATTARVRFDEAGVPAWEDVTPPHAIPFNLDPILFTDPETGHTVAGGLEGECSVLWSTKDDGESWLPWTNACASPAFDHETVATGPMPAPFDAVPGLRAAYYCAQASVIQCASSQDGGLTFGPPVPVSPGQSAAKLPVPLCFGPSGHVKVGPRGTAYVPSSHCQTRQGVMVSEDNGATWITRTLEESSIAVNTFDPAVAPTPEDGLYMTWVGANVHPYAAYSPDHGVTWSYPVDLGKALGLRGATFTTMVAGDDARAAVAFLGTTDAGEPNKPGFTGAWWLYVAVTLDQGVTWTTTRASPDPVQHGWICSSGITCGGGRNLLDFIDVTMDHEGRVVVVYADGCLPGCTGVGDSWRAQVTLARQAAGPRLLAAFDA